MVWFAEDNDLKSSKDPFEILDPPPTDFSFADSFLDFDSIQQWFEDKSSSDMAAEPNDTDVIHAADPSIQIIEANALPQQVLPGPYPNVGNVQISECENLVALGSAIEEGMGKISLSVGIHSEVMADEDESSSTSSSSSSSTSSGSSCSRDSSSCSDGDTEEEQHPDEKGEGKTEDIDEELEEGEIRDSDGKEPVSETAAVDTDDDSDVEKTFSWIAMSDDDDDDDGDDDDGNDDNASGRLIRSTNELEALPPVPSVDVTLEPYHQMQPVGVVMSIMGAKVVVEGLEKHCPLDEGSILWMTESRKPLGLVDEVFGPVRSPYYVVRYNSENEVPGVCCGASVSFVPEFANHVLNNKDVYKKGYDASGSNDEELSNDLEFSDDEKEDEYRRKQRVTKRGINDQNPANRKNNRKKNYQNPANRKNYRKKIPVKAGAIPAITLLGHGNCPPFSGIGQVPDEADNIVPPFPPTSVNPYSAANGIQTNGSSLSQPQPPLLPNGFPTNGASWFSQNPRNSFQFPVPEIPFQHQFNPSQGSLSTNMFPGVLQPNIFARPTYVQRFMGQNQIAFGLSSHRLQFQPPIHAGKQGVRFNQMQLGRNHNSRLRTTIPGNIHVPGQFHPGASAGRGRTTFQRGGRKGWRPAK